MAWQHSSVKFNLISIHGYRLGIMVAAQEMPLERRLPVPPMHDSAPVQRGSTGASGRVGPALRMTEAIGGLAGDPRGREPGGAMERTCQISPAQPAQRVSPSWLADAA